MKPATNVTHLTDEELVELARCDQQAASELLVRYKPLVRSRSRKLFLPGSDQQDLIQEGMIGLFKAISAYDLDSGVPFRAFAVQCVQSRLDDAIRQANRDKHRPLNNSLSLDSEVGEFDDAQDKGNLADIIAAPNLTPEERILNQEQLQALQTYITEELSEFEGQVLEYFLQGLSYRAISERLGVTERSVDGALQRLRRKIKQYRDRS